VDFELQLRMMEVLVRTGAKMCYKATTSKSVPGFLQARCPSWHPTNSVKALKGESVSFHGLAHSKLTCMGSSVIVLTTKRSFVKSCQTSHQLSDVSTPN